jgi:hypothetical protein
MQYAPVNLKRFYIDIIVAGCVVIFVLLAYFTGKAQNIATNIVTSGGYDASTDY